MPRTKAQRSGVMQKRSSCAATATPPSPDPASPAPAPPQTYRDYQDLGGN